MTAQTPAPASPVETRPSQTTGKPEYVIKARVPLTIVDVVVTDAKGKPVHGLKQSDFTVLEDKQEMTPKSFEEHRSDAQPGLPAESAPAVKLTLGPNTFANAVPPPGAGPLNILLLDSLNTPVIVQGIVRQQMLAFLDKVPAGTRMEVLSLSTDRFAVLQGSTTDRELLKAAVAGKNPPQFARLEDPQQDPTQEPMSLEEEGTLTAIRADTVISSMRQIARYLGGVPGRKNLLWFSGAFPLQFPPQPLDPDVWPMTEMFDDTDAMKAAGDLLARAHVAVYPVDGRGLEDIKLRTRKGELRFAEHGTMEMVAELTGGKAVYDYNGLTEAAEAAIDQGSNYYTLTYTPVNQALDTRFRSIGVKVDQPGLHLVYRDGYYAVDPDTDAHGKQIAKVTAMQSAMMRGGLDATQILFKVKVAQAPGTEEMVPVSNQPDLKKMKPPYRHYTVSFVIDIHGIDFSATPDGNYRGDFEFGTMVYNADGDEVMNSASKEVSPILPPAVYQSMLEGGANAHQEIDVPATGEYFLRIGVHDLTSDRVGAIEVPVSSIAPQAVPAMAAGK